MSIKGISYNDEIKFKIKTLHTHTPPKKKKKKKKEEKAKPCAPQPQVPLTRISPSMISLFPFHL
jgi:hypothetical protein